MTQMHNEQISRNVSIQYLHFWPQKCSIYPTMSMGVRYEFSSKIQKVDFNHFLIPPSGTISEKI